jgi:hypothetical protein
LVRRQTRMLEARRTRAGLDGMEECDARAQTSRCKHCTASAPLALFARPRACECIEAVTTSVPYKTRWTLASESIGVPTILQKVTK